MATRAELFGEGKYLKACDLAGKPLTVVIESVRTEVMKSSDGKEGPKDIVSFKELRKSLPLNLVNWDSIANITGEDDSVNFRGHAIELFPTRTTLRGESVDCIRVRPPAQRELPRAKPDDTDIPF